MTWTHGCGAELFDQEGHSWLDAGVSDALLGHGHPAVAAAVAEELQRGRPGDQLRAHCIERLLAKFPAAFDTCYLTNSLSEANELALRLAREHGAGKDVIVLEGAEHGMTTSLVNMGPSRRKFWVQEASRIDAASVADKAQAIRASGRGLCAFFAEGVFESGYLGTAYSSVRAAGGLNIAVEAQTGMGRIGEPFWEFARHGVDPDIVVVGESLANGLPLAAVVTKSKFAAPFAVDFHPSSAVCAAALAVLDSLRIPPGGYCREIPVPNGPHAVERLRAQRVLISARGNKLLFRPPLCFSTADEQRFEKAISAAQPET